MRSLLYILILFVITGCSYSSSHVFRELDEAEALMQADPSAAMERLSQYDISEFNDSAAMARWALLYSEALFANKITAPTDTIINIAIDYYRRHNISEKHLHAKQLKQLLQSSGDSDALAEAIYFQKEKEFLLYKERTTRKQFLLYGLILILATSGIITLQRQRLKLKIAQNESLIAEASSLREGLTRNQSIYSKLQSKFTNLIANRFDIIDQLCATYYESQGTKSERKSIADKVKSQIDELKSDSGLFAEMEKCANDCHGGIIDFLNQEIPNIKPEEYRLFIYLACNLSNRSIALLLGESIDVVYKRKSRLKSKLSTIGNHHADLFMSIF